MYDVLSSGCWVEWPLANSSPGAYQISDTWVVFVPIAMYQFQYIESRAHFIHLLVFQLLLDHHKWSTRIVEGLCWIWSIDQRCLHLFCKFPLYIVKSHHVGFMYQLCDSHMTVTWQSSDNHMIVRWQLSDGCMVSTQGTYDLCAHWVTVSWEGLLSNCQVTCMWKSPDVQTTLQWNIHNVTNSCDFDHYFLTMFADVWVNCVIL